MTLPVHAPIGEFTIAAAAAQRETLLQTLADDGPELWLDLSHVEACDSAGVQLLLSLQHSARQRGQRLCITEPSEPVRQALATYGLSTRLLTPSGEAA
ncbi:STAS domain-containing protein [Ideonella sp. A 288]|uniref:STAS domain-containing protein n=1 Tax=Ideonella sp. A 288 TaxID=1962181 RepID=UPI000B4B41F6|nr:STAS domain-containing protein [Ideonella sp. A 288]